MKLKSVFAWTVAISTMALAAEDAYVGSNGSQGINTGYCMTPDSNGNGEERR